jgi:predicted acylesterase/phospholipase RssA
LNDLIKEVTGEVTLNQLPIDILITAVRVQDAHLWWFVKDNPGNAKMTGNLKLADCITASSAVPIYFRPWHLPTIGDCVDGGASFATNPVYRTTIEAFDYTGGKYIPRDTIVVSIGTGHYEGPFTPKSIFPMLGFTLEAVLGTTAELQTELVRKFCNPLALYRINIKLPYDIGMDEFSASEKLVEYGRELASQVDWRSILAGEANRWLVT